MVVRIIACSMVAEVCSIYLRRASGEMELFATEGLDPGAVHVTRLKPGEGLVGEIMRPAGRSTSPTPPAIRPSPTGRRPARTRSTPSWACRCCAADGRSACWWSRTAPAASTPRTRSRTCRSSPWSWPRWSPPATCSPATSSRTSRSRRGGPNGSRAPSWPTAWRFGVAVLHEAPVAAGPAAVGRHRRRGGAPRRRHRQPAGADRRHARGPRRVLGASYDVLETYRMLAHSRSWNHSLLGGGALRPDRRGGGRARALRAPRRPGPGARSLPARAGPRPRGPQRPPAAPPGRRWRPGARAAGKRHPDRPQPRPGRPAGIRPRASCAGCLLEEGSPASHAAIVARALDIPCVGRLAGLRDKVSEGDPVIVDAESGEAYLRPRADVVKAIRARMGVRAQRRAEFARLRDTPAFTRDGAKIDLLMNAGLAVDLDLPGRDRRRGHRPVPHRVPVHGLRGPAALQRPDAALRQGAGRRRRPAGHLPHPRPRRRQGAALSGGRAGGQSGARLARHPHGPGPARPCCACSCAP